MQINIQHCGPIMLSGSVDWLPAGQETLDRGCPSDDWEGLVHQSPRAESTSFPTSSGHQPFKGDKLQAYQCGRLPLEPVWSSGLPLLPIKRSVDIEKVQSLWKRSAKSLSAEEGNCLEKWTMAYTVNARGTNIVFPFPCDSRLPRLSCAGS